MSQGGKRLVFLFAGILGALVVVAKVTFYLLDVLQPYRLPASDWKIYRENFISAEGRVIDTGNENVSHSEGQGYGLLIAAAYGDRRTFDLIWEWTRKNLQTRPNDKLLSWLWKPSESGGAVADPNNASDGDLLVAWALVRASRQWNEYRYEQAAAQILLDLARLDVKEGPDGPYLLPGTDGFYEDTQTKKTEPEAAPSPSPAPTVASEEPKASPATEAVAAAPVETPSPTPTPSVVPAAIAETTPAPPLESKAPEAPAPAVDTPADENKITETPAPTPLPPEEMPAVPKKAAVTLNASYYIFPALDEIATVFPAMPWAKVSKAGHVLVQKGSFGKWHLPPDWTLVSDGEFQISPKFPPLFGYNAVRVPLHLAWKNPSAPLLEPFATYWKQFGSGTIPATVDLANDAFGKDPALPGMRAIATLTIHCVEKRNLTVRAIPVLTKGEPYFSASLTLLTKIAVRETFAKN